MKNKSSKGKFASKTKTGPSFKAKKMSAKVAGKTNVTSKGKFASKVNAGKSQGKVRGKGGKSKVAKAKGSGKKFNPRAFENMKNRVFATSSFK